MNTRQQLRQHIGTRTAVISAAVAGFLVGAGGFAAAQIGPEATPAASSTLDSNTVRSEPVSARASGNATLSSGVEAAGRLTISVDSSSTSVPDSSSTSIADSSSTSIADSSSTSIADSSSTSVPDSSSTSVPDSSSTSVPDSSSTSVPESSSTSIADTSSTVASSTVAALPGPFTETYASAGGSITVSWSGTAFSLLAVTPVAGFQAEIEDHAQDRIRVDFEGDDDDARIEVRLDDSRIRVRID